jgi:hypothetical protein
MRMQESSIVACCHAIAIVENPMRDQIVAPPLFPMRDQIVAPPLFPMRDQIVAPPLFPTRDQNGAPPLFLFRWTLTSPIVASVFAGISVHERKERN